MVLPDVREKNAPLRSTRREPPRSRPPSAHRPTIRESQGRPRRPWTHRAWSWPPPSSEPPRRRPSHGNRVLNDDSFASAYGPWSNDHQLPPGRTHESAGCQRVDFELPALSECDGHGRDFEWELR